LEPSHHHHTGRYDSLLIFLEVFQDSDNLVEFPNSFGASASHIQALPDELVTTITTMENMTADKPGAYYKLF